MHLAVVLMHAMLSQEELTLGALIAADSAEIAVRLYTRRLVPGENVFGEVARSGVRIVAPALAASEGGIIKRGELARAIKRYNKINK